MRRLTGIITIVAMAAFCGAAHACKPLKVYILVGQSNMQGKANIRTAKHMAGSPETKPLHDKLIGADDKAKTFDQIRIAAFSQAKGNNVEKSGSLSFGYGDELSNKDVCGPELAFGVTMHEIVKEPILLIKTAWGGKSLYGDFRPPSAGAHEYAPDPGQYYRLMVKHVKAVLADPGKYHPAYKKADGYEIAGFVWFQGWNDMVDGRVYRGRWNPGGYDDYTKVMKLFIKDVRKEFDAPKMPFVIGVLGVGGSTEFYYKNPPISGYKFIHQSFRDAMAAPAEDPELKDTVKAVLTENFWPYDIEETGAKVKKFNNEAKEALKKEQEKNPKLTGKAAWRWQQDYAKKLIETQLTDKERLALAGTSSQGYHYHGSLKFYSLAGEAFAKAVAECK